MKSWFICLLVISFPMSLFAQQINLKDIDASSEDTTIQISKGKKTQQGAEKCLPAWEITDGSDDLSGEPTIMSKEANQSWRKACDDWKKEFRKDNKENKIINISCGSVSCTSDAGGKICSSKATYKIKTRID
jgi:hypothetical protein